MAKPDPRLVIREVFGGGGEHTLPRMFATRLVTLFEKPNNQGLNGGATRATLSLHFLRVAPRSCHAKRRVNSREVFITSVGDGRERLSPII